MPAMEQRMYGMNAPTLHHYPHSLTGNWHQPLQRSGPPALTSMYGSTPLAYPGAHCGSDWGLTAAHHHSSSLTNNTSSLLGGRDTHDFYNTGMHGGQTPLSLSSAADNINRNTANAAAAAAAAAAHQNYQNSLNSAYMSVYRKTPSPILDSPQKLMCASGSDSPGAHSKGSGERQGDGEKGRVGWREGESGIERVGNESLSLFYV